MRNYLARQKKYWSNGKFFASAVWGIMIFLTSLEANFLASFYATDRASSSVNDLILSNIPVVNVNLIVSEGALFFVIFIFVLLVFEPRRIPFILKSLALLVLIRSAFVTLTHLGPFPERSYLDPTDLMIRFNTGGDFFFSGHTALPFLMALVFWDERFIRNVCLAGSAIFGASVLLGHLHYSIDVFSAFFITYGVFHIARHYFPHDYELFHKGIKS